jgi:hypothetical protein
VQESTHSSTVRSRRGSCDSSSCWDLIPVGIIIFNNSIAYNVHKNILEIEYLSISYISNILSIFL